MHIAIVSEHFHKKVSGPRRAFLHMARELHELGHELTLVNISRQRGREDIPGGQAHHYKYSWKLIPVKYGRPRYFARKILKHHRQKPFDVVWAMGLESAAAALKFRQKTGVPFVINPRSFLMEKPGDWKFDRARLLIRECDALIALSDSAADRWCEALGYTRDSKVFAVMNGVRPGELEGEARRPKGLGDQPIILSMGMLRGPKGHHFVIRALAQCCKDLDWQLVIAGEGPWREKLQELMETESLSKRAHLVGMVQGAEWRWLFRNANVFALYSVYPEAGGNAYIEAQAAGLPIVTSDQGSLPLVVPHDEVGLIVPREPKETEIERLGQALRRVLEDEDLRKRLGEGGRKHASELTWRHCAEGYLKAMKYAMT